jgi:hypothetical protein
MSEWIALADKLPEMDRIVLAWGDIGSYEVAQRQMSTHYGWHWWTIDGSFPQNDFTHWMALPDSPDGRKP